MKISELNLVEAKGFFGRRPGDPYVHTDGITAEFKQVTPFPAPKQGAYSSAEERDQNIANLEKKVLRDKILWVNNPGNNKAFAVAQLQTSDGDAVYWGRYINTTQGVLTGKWANNEIPAGWKLNTATSQKLATGYDPQTLVGVGTSFPNIDQALLTIKTKLKNVEHEKQLSEALAAVRQGQLPVFKGMAAQMPALRDYFGEILTPVALASGVIGGDADLARKDVLGSPYAKCKVRWPMSKTHNLVDSVFQSAKGVDLGISSKGGAGAKASAKNIYDAIEKARTTNPKLIKTYKKVVNAINIINTLTALDAPLELGVAFGLIDARVGQDCRNMINTGVNKLPAKYAKLCSNFTPDLTNKNYNAGLHLLSSIAKHVANRLNAIPNMSEGIKAFMNQSSIVQIYLDMKVQGQDAVVTGFRSVYPPNFEGTMIIDAGKSYYATMKPSKFAFGFK
jgi:hypothetical protein